MRKGTDQQFNREGKRRISQKTGEKVEQNHGKNIYNENPSETKSKSNNIELSSNEKKKRMGSPS